MSELFGILFLTIVAPCWIIFHYITKWKMSKGMSPEEGKLLEEIWQSAQRMESRVNSLETILDDHTGDWRNKT